MTTHAILGPSGHSKWSRCPGSALLEKDLPETSSAYADEGTDAHELAAMCIIDGKDAEAYIGRIMGKGTAVDAEMAEHVQVYIDLVRQLHDNGANPLMVEQRVPVGAFTGEDGAEGTSDAVIYQELPDGSYEVIVVDLKYGRGVLVDAEENGQLMLYALGAVELASSIVDVSCARLMISQPRASKAPSEWPVKLEELNKFAARTALTGKAALKMRSGELEPVFNPGAKQCKFCKAKASCPALTGLVMEEIKVVPAEVSNDDLGAHLNNVDLIREWCNAIEAKAESELHRGNPVAGYKLVQGKRGNRAWTNEAEAEAILKSMRLKTEQMYKMKLISPTDAEKQLKESPKRWSRLVDLIVQAEGKPTVAQESDKRPALVVIPTLDEIPDLSFEDLA